MKYAGKTFTLYASQPVAIQGSDSLYTHQNTGTGTATIVGSNNAVNWTTVATVVSGASYTGSHAYAFLMMTGSTEVSVSRGAAGDNSFSSSNPLPVANTGYHYSVTGKTNADGVVTLTATQIPTLAAAWKNRITISKGTVTSGTLGIEIKLVGATAYSTLLENGSAVVVNFASITEPTTYVFDGDIEGWQITPTSVVGEYDVSVAGH